MFFIQRFTCTRKGLPKTINYWKKHNIQVILDYTNENKKNVDKNYQEILDLIQHYPNHHIALKLSSINFNTNFLQNIMNKSIQKNCKILIDAENFEIQDQIEKLTNDSLEIYNKGNVHVYKTYQMYRNDYFDILKKDLEKERDFSLGVKLVRGAYYNQDYKHGILFPTIEETHQNYNNAINLFLEKRQKNDMLICATHNEKSISKAQNVKNIEFAQLMGMHDKFSKNLAKDHVVYKYIPYGNFVDTIPYLIRRLYENYPMITNFWK
jgi:hypothetical protein